MHLPPVKLVGKGNSEIQGYSKWLSGVLTTCHTQYTWDRSICVILFNRTTLQVFVTYLTGALYVHTLWFYKHQYDNRVRSKLFQWRFWFLSSVPGYTRTLSLETVHTTFEWNCQKMAVSRIWCELPLDNCTPTIILNNPVLRQLISCYW